MARKQQLPDPLFTPHDLILAMGLDGLAMCKPEGFSLSYRAKPKTQSGGAWIARIKRAGKFVSVQRVNPIRAVQLCLRLAASSDTQWRCCKPFPGKVQVQE